MGGGGEAFGEHRNGNRIRRRNIYVSEGWLCGF